MRRKKLHYLVLNTAILCTIGWLPQASPGQDHHIDSSPRFQTITHEQGLSHNSVNTIFQDHQGYMWFGTNNGLDRYNGYHISAYQYHPDDTSSISYNEISDIIEDQNNTLWIGTQGRGLNRYNRDLDNFTRFTADDETAPETGLSENTASCLAEDEQGFIWIGTEYGLNRLDTKTETFTHYHADPDDPNSLSDDVITSLLFDSNNNLWIGTHNGLNVKREGREHFEVYRNDPDDPRSIGDDLIWDIIEDRNGNIWIGTRNGGLNKFDPQTETFTRHMHDASDPYSISDNAVYTLLEDSRGVLWAGTESHGLNTFDRKNNRFYRHKSDVDNPYSISFDGVHTLFESNNNLLWVGLFSGGGGVNFTDLKPTRFEFYEYEPFNQNTLSNNNVVCFGQDKDQYIWVGTDGGGLNRFDPVTREFTTYLHDPEDPNTPPSNVILDVETGPEGYLWIATYRGGVSRIDIDNQSYTHFQHDPEDPKSMNTNNAFRLNFVDNELWIGTHGGGINVLNLQTEEIRHYRYSDETNGLENDYIQTIYTDSEGILWFGTHGGGLVRYNEDEDSFSHFSEYNEMLSSIVATSIDEDKEGRFWVGTNRGLNLFDRESESYEVYTIEDGLISDYINGLLLDDDDNLWISTNIGISKFYPDTGEFENYHSDAGLRGNEFNMRSYYKDSNGYLYFGGVSGFSRFHPDNVAPNPDVAPVVFTNFMIYNQPVAISEDTPLQKHISQTDHITVSHDQSVLTFEFVTLNFEIHKKDQFAYRLDGFDSDWNHIGEQRSATYTNLSPGEYLLRVIATNSDGVKGTEEATVGLTVTPPFWRTIWFYVISGIAITGLVFGAYRRRVYSISEQNRLLEEEVKARTTELYQSNAKLKDTLQELQSTRDELVEKAHKAGMADIATNVLHDVGNILNSVNVSASIISDTVRHSNLQKLHKANNMLRDHLDSLEDFIRHDPKGKALMEYYVKLDHPLMQEYNNLAKQNQRLTEKVNLIVEVIKEQQSHSMAGRIEEEHPIEKVVEDTLKITQHNIQENGIQVIRQYGQTRPITIQKNKMTHILVNIIKNAVESIVMQNSELKQITINSWEDHQSTYLTITDTGVGFDENTKAKLFTHGFTNKSEGHGYGLHNCANSIKEMGGTIRAESPGVGQGATFIIQLPLSKDPSS